MLRCSVWLSSHLIRSKRAPRTQCLHNWVEPWGISLAWILFKKLKRNLLVEWSWNGNYSQDPLLQRELNFFLLPEHVTLAFSFHFYLRMHYNSYLCEDVELSVFLYRVYKPPTLSHFFYLKTNIHIFVIDLVPHDPYYMANL